ncbi:TPA: hypothetical protein ACGO1F_001452 [Streptococcus suis]
MKLSDVFSKNEFERIKNHLSKWEYDKEYSDGEIDLFDEELDELNQEIGYENEFGIFLSDMIGKLRTNPQY